MTTDLRELFIHLVRLGIGLEPVPDVMSQEPCDVDWVALKALAAKQGLSAVVLDGIAAMPSERGQEFKTEMPQKLRRQWIGEVIRFYETRYQQYEKAISSLAGFYNQHGYKMMVLKGYACSLDWPKPNHRPCGDIDIWLFGRRKEADKLICEHLCIRVDEEYHKHSHFTFHGLTVENHGKFIDDIAHKSNIGFEKLLEELLIEEEKSLKESPISNCLLPSPTWNALFLLRHAGEHFASCEITLRHVIDLGTFFKVHHDEINWGRVLDAFENEGLKRFYDSIATICVRELGFEPLCFCGYNSNEKLADRIFEDIYAKKECLPNSMVGIDSLRKRVRYVIDKSLRWWKNRWKYKLVYKESLWESFWGLAINRIKN